MFRGAEHLQIQSDTSLTPNQHYHPDLQSARLGLAPSRGV